MKMMPPSSPYPRKLVLLAGIAAFAAAGCASAPSKPGGTPDAQTRAMRAEATRTLERDGFPANWELPAGAAAAAPASGGFPEGWELAEEKAPRKPVEARRPAAPVAVSASPVVSSTVASEADVAKARTQVGKAENLLGRLRSTGYRVLVEDDLKAIDAVLEDARRALSAGNVPDCRRLSDECARRLERARVRIETETRQPLRW